MTVCGHDVATNSEAVKKKVGYLPEHNPLYPEMYVKEFLDFIGGLHGIPNRKGRIAEMVNITGLQAEQHKKIGALSKGYRQRLGLAQAMIHDPEVLILDEPTSGLDPNQLGEIRELIKNLGKERTVIFSSHILQEVTAISNRVIIINEGKLVADNTIENLKKTIQGEVLVTIRFKEEANQKELASIPGVRAVKTLPDQRWQLTTDPDEEIRERVFKFAVDNNLTLLDLTREEQSLEDVFKQLTK